MEIRNLRNRTISAILLSLGVIGPVWAQKEPAVRGTGAPGSIPVWTDSDRIGNSIASQSGTTVNVAGTVAATSLSGDGSAVKNVNAAKLGGLLPGAFAQLNVSNTFTTGQTINGSINNTLTLQGNLTDILDDVGANVIGGFGGSNFAAGNSVAAGVLGATISGGGGVVRNGNSALGCANTVTQKWGTVGGGLCNQTGGDHATVGGGGFNAASGYAATVAGGNGNIASGDFATVAGGLHNLASGMNSFAAGTGDRAIGNGSFAIGSGADANFDGSFVWRDQSTSNFVASTAANEFVARAAGGVVFYTTGDLSTGAKLAAGSGSWASLSDRNVKDNIALVDGLSLLRKLADMPISTWNYKAQRDTVRHLGPMAQDFWAAFGLGEDDTHISTVDSEGVALAAIQALYQLSQQENASLREEINQLRAEVTGLAGRR